MKRVTDQYNILPQACDNLLSTLPHKFLEKGRLPAGNFYRLSDVLSKRSDGGTDVNSFTEK